MQKKRRSILGYLVLGIICVITGFNVMNGLIHKQMNDFFMINLFLFVVGVTDILFMSVNVGNKRDEKVKIAKLKSASWAGLTNLVILFIFAVLAQFHVVDGNLSIRFALILSFIPYAVYQLVLLKRI
jgi:hypothetical protein